MRAKREARESHFIFLGVQKSVREWTLTLPKELSIWELESLWTPKFSKNNRKGQNSLDWGVSYIIRNLLKRKCLKWICMTHLNIWNTSYGQKKGRKSNWQFDSRPLKVRNQPNFLAYYIPLESSWQGLQLCFRPHINRRSVEKVMGPQSRGNLKFENFWTPTWESRDKSHLDVALVEKHIVYYKGEGGFPQIRAVVNFVSPNLSMVRCNTKSAQIMHKPTCCLICIDMCEWLSACHFS